HRHAQRRSRLPEPAVRDRRSAGTTRRTFGSEQRLRRAGHAGAGARDGDLLFDSGQHPASRRSRAERGEGVPRDEGGDHRSRDGGDGSGRRRRRRQPLFVPAPARGWIEGADSLRWEDRARRLHPDGGEDRHQRRLAQQRPVHDVHPRGAARQAGQRDSPGREPESREDAAHALRRVAQDAAGVVQVIVMLRLAVAVLALSLTALATQPPGLVPPKPSGEGGLVPPKPSGEGGLVPPKPQGEGGQPPPGTPAAAQPQRGRGGRGGVQVMTLTSSAWSDGGQIPAKYSQATGDVSPPLAWSNVPDNIAGFVLVAHDLDAAVNPGTDDLLHWLVWNIPGTARSLPEHVPQGATLPDGSRQISATGPNYRAPGAPASGPPHHYVFELYALDAAIDVAAVGASPAQTRAAVMAAMAGHVRAKGVIMGLYKRP